MITALARGEMNTVILPVQVPFFACMILVALGAIPLFASARIMRDSRDLDTRRSAREIFWHGVAMVVVPLLMIIGLMFVYQSQGGFE